MILKPTAMDTIIQSSTVELMHSYGLPLAPRGRSENRGHAANHEGIGIIRFDGPGIGGRLTVSVPRAVFEGLGSVRAQGTSHGDWTLELTNQLMGRVKNRLMQFQLRLKTHIPTVLSGAAMKLQTNWAATEIWYVFAALRGEVVVTVDASLAEAVLSYSNASVVVPEGELILFD